MKYLRRSPVKFAAQLTVLFLFLAAAAIAQTCVTADEMDAATKSALTSTAQRYFGMVGQGDVASLRQNAIAGLAANFGGIEAAVTENKANLVGVSPSVRPPYLLKLEGAAPVAAGRIPVWSLWAERSNRNQRSIHNSKLTSCQLRSDGH